MRATQTCLAIVVTFALTGCDSSSSSSGPRRGGTFLPTPDAMACVGTACGSSPADAAADAFDAAVDAETDAACADPDGGCGDGGPTDAGSDACDLFMACDLTPTCIGGQLYPSSCGPANCSKPLGPCDNVDGGACNPLQICGQALTCVAGKLYPSTCGPSNCDRAIGTCDGGVGVGISP